MNKNILFSKNYIMLFFFQLIPIVVEIYLMGYRNNTFNDNMILLLTLLGDKSHGFFKVVFIQITIYVSLFFILLVMCGILIKEQMPKKLVC